MEIIITEAATAKIKEKTVGRDGYLKLKYDIEGCGCAVDGVFALWFISELDEDDTAIETNNGPIYMEKSKMVFFDENMKIDYSDSMHGFQLKSPQQILNGHMSLIIK
ncbi:MULTISPECIES: iron-sulfur cluster biosynthesis family protein [Bacillaceae]|uniref:iron-sulfur cluster biosynthesis family protein n=1 Tax=Bacillaceae TaxID=186817 RepID=UPI002FFE0490